MNLDSLIAGMRKDTLFANLGIIRQNRESFPKKRVNTTVLAHGNQSVVV